MGTIIKIMGLHLWGIIITIWGLQEYNNKNKGATLAKIRDYTSNIGT